MSELELRHVSKSFQVGAHWWGARRIKRAVSDVSFTLHAGETLAIVGESGSGKSTTARIAMRLLDADAGEVLWKGERVEGLSRRALRPLRRHIQMVFQDPFASLNPRMKIWRSVAEGLRVQQPGMTRAQLRARVAEVLQQCGLDAAMMDRYPHQFSGGQRQRIGIARGLIVRPSVLVLDEPVSALDVSVQAQILNLLQTLQQRHALAYLFISHDLAVVRHVAERVVVMFAGRMVESGPVDRVLQHPAHPYTRALLDASPVVHPSQRVAREEHEAQETPPAAEGCPFRPRCPRARDDCAAFACALQGGAHQVACRYPLTDD
ncbi:MAG: ATP-binding cassette domain-containing protein [Zetaproteobacteria bacterium]|nr:MAG: ATP-binding cassette domain-containing protein [Zetaproteobacteria bacterium]